ncbi:hypothetical protein [Roseivirga misakiensis]|uniref:Uncharacterized protein n=1 Tax=Roseivirga misakiensis TaxID=1563681 RepID=A0A1E5T210_9BACT|nr:hypothetical protein [Roseivirga misakiensis]OEK05414.1 hypothetical protein BFP71_18665 [Roseivirga misakiensis]
MEGERDNIDQFFQDHFSAFEKSPSQSVWAGIKKYGLMANGAKLTYLGNAGYLILITILAAGLITLGVIKSNIFDTNAANEITKEYSPKINKGSEVATLKKEDSQKEKEQLKPVSKSHNNDTVNGSGTSENSRDNDDQSRTLKETTEETSVSHSGASATETRVIGKGSGGAASEVVKSAQENKDRESQTTYSLDQSKDNSEPLQRTNEIVSNRTFQSDDLKITEDFENEDQGFSTQSVGDLPEDQINNKLSNPSRGPLPIVKTGVRKDISLIQKPELPELNGDIALVKPSTSLTRGMEIINEHQVVDSLRYNGWAISILQRYETTFGSEVNLDVAYYLSRNSFIEAGAGIANQFNNDFRVSYNYTFGKGRIKPYAIVQLNGSGIFSDNSITAGVGLIYDVIKEGRWRIFTSVLPTRLTNFESVTLRLGLQYRFTPPSKYEYSLPESEYAWFFSMAYQGRFGGDANILGLPAVEAQMGKFIAKRTFFNISLNTELVAGVKLEHYLLTTKRLDLGAGLGLVASLKGSLQFDPMPEVIAYYKVSDHWKIFSRYTLRREPSQIMPEHVAIGFQRGILRRKE